MSSSDHVSPKQFPRSVVSSVGIGTRHNATNNMTGEKHVGITQTALTKVTAGAVKMARAQGMSVDEHSRVPHDTKFPGE